MKNRRICKLILSGIIGGILPLAAQWHREPTPNDTLQSVRILNDGRVALSIYAPHAQDVRVSGDFPPQKATRTESGVWTAIVPDIKDGLYRYSFTVDGVNVYDPVAAPMTNTGTCSARTWPNIFFVIYRPATRKAQRNCPFFT